MAGHDMLGQPVFEHERALDVVIRSDDQLAQGDLQAGRRFGQQRGADLRRPVAVRPARGGFLFQCGEDGFDRLAGKAAVDRRAAGGNRRGARLGMEAG